jgi:hypothetical protein
MKNEHSSIIEPDSYILPNENDKMREFVKKFKIDMMEHIVGSIKFAVENKLDIVEVFQFKNSKFVVTINKTEFVPNLDHISQYYKKNEIFELCPRVEELRKILKDKPDEKEKPDNTRPDKPES